MPENYGDESLNSILKKLTILYIEDEDNIRENVTKALEIISEKVYDVNSAEMAKEILTNKRVDIIISDINLPNTSGIEFVKDLRNIDKTIPIILLSAYTDKEYLLEATKLKLIDYLTKPIDFKALNEALLKCVEDIIDNSRYIISFTNNVNYNVLYKRLYNHKSDEELTLTSKELDMLDYLIQNNNRIVSHDELKLNIWQDSFEATDSALKNLLNKLRKKIGKETIVNISGVGYRIQF